MLTTEWFYITETLRTRFFIDVYDYGGGGGKRGLGVWYQRGCSGSTHGEEGTNEYLTLSCLLTRWTFNAMICWKGKE